MIMIINNYITGLCIYYTILFIVILMCTLFYSYKKVYCKTVCRVMPATASYILCLPCFLTASLSLVLHLISCCFVQQSLNKKKKNPKENSVKGLAEAFTDLHKLPKKSENMDQNTKRFTLIERNVHGALSTYKQIYDEKKQTNHIA